MMNRRTLREHVFKMLFSVDFYPSEEADEQLQSYLEDQVANEEDHQELMQRTISVLEKIPELDKLIEDNTEGWKIQRIGKAELNLLRLAVFEMKFDENVPDKVAINEAVELSKKYGADEAPSFINGVLAKLV